MPSGKADLGVVKSTLREGARRAFCSRRLGGCYEYLDTPRDFREDGLGSLGGCRPGQMDTTASDQSLSFFDTSVQ